MTFRRIENLDEPEPSPNLSRNRAQRERGPNEAQASSTRDTEGTEADSGDDEDDIRDYMRVRLIREREIRQNASTVDLGLELLCLVGFPSFSLSYTPVM
jgi:hypothetical protein